MIVDPHTAVGLYSGHQNCKTVYLATAHPCKFPNSIELAEENEQSKICLDEIYLLNDLLDKESKCITMSNCTEKVKKYIDQLE